MNNVFLDLQIEIRAIMGNLLQLSMGASDIYASYFNTSASSDISGVGSDSTAVTFESKLTKGIYISSISFFEDVEDFFSNTAVTTTDYLSTVNKVRYGVSSADPILSEPVEEIGNSIKTNCDLAFFIYQKALNITETYFDNQVDSMISSLSDQKILPGVKMTKSLLTSAITLLQEYRDMLGNAAVATGDYLSTVNKWISEIEA